MAEFKAESMYYSELAELFFPKMTKKKATETLTRCIQGSKTLRDELTQNGYDCFKHGRRSILVPKLVQIIANHLILV